MDSRIPTVLGACLTQFTVIGLMFTYGLFVKIFEAEFGWSRTMLSAVSSLSFFIMGFLAMFAGRLNDRFGPRIVLSMTGTIYGTGFVLISLIDAPWQLFVLFGVFIGIGLASHDVVTLSTIARLFEARRGIMTAVVKVGTAAGQVVVPPLAAVLIAGLGWRDAFVVLGLGGGVVLLAAAMMMRTPDTLPAPSGKAPPAEEFRRARNSPTFWKMCAVQFLFFTSLTTIPLHIVVHGQDLGMTATSAAVLLSISGAASAIGRLAVGTLLDRIGGPRSYLLCLGPLLAGLTAFLWIDVPWLLMAAMAVYGFGHGGLFTVVSPTVAEYFGTRSHGALFGTVLFCGTIGGALGPIVAGWIFDITGSYIPAFAGLAGMSALAIALVLTLPRVSQAASEP